LHYFYELSLRDVSEITDTNYNTVVSWHKRALKQLGILLSNQNNER
jgi:DNA-directed RNA polymerase specialized sigma24 family protein